MKKPVNFRLNEELYKALQEMAKEEYMNATQLVEKLIHEEMKKRGRA